MPEWYSNEECTGITQEADQRLQNWTKAVQEIDDSIKCNNLKVAFQMVNRLTKVK